MNILLEYLRLACYGVVISSAIASINRKRFSKCILIADIIFATLLFLASIFKGTLVWGLDTRDTLLTPAVVIWASLHYYNLLRQ